MAYLSLKLFLATSIFVSVCYAQEADKSFTKKPTVPEKPHEEAWSIPNFDDLLRLFAREDSSAFWDAVERSQGNDAPTLEELPEISNDLIAGNIPKYLIDRQFTTFNSIGNYSYSDSNRGEFSGVIYGHNERNGTSGSFSSFTFTDMQGEVGTTEYSAGTILFSRVHYCIRRDHVAWEGYTQGSFLWKLPTGLFVSYGSYIGSTEGKFGLDSKPEHFHKTLSIMDTDSYYSKTITTANGDIEETRYDMISVTGGTNGTIYSSITFSGENEMLADTKLELFNSNRNATGDSFAKLSSTAKNDNHDHFSDASLYCYFLGMHTTVGIYLP